MHFSIDAYPDTGTGMLSSLQRIEISIFFPFDLQCRRVSMTRENEDGFWLLAGAAREKLFRSVPGSAHRKTGCRSTVCVRCMEG